MLLGRLARGARNRLVLIAAVEMLIVGLAAIAVFMALADQYARVTAAVDENALARPRATVVVAVPPSPSTPTPVQTQVSSSVTPSLPPIATRTLLLTPSLASPSPTRTAQSQSTLQAKQPTARATLSGARPTPIVPAQSWRLISECGPISSPGYYRLTQNVTTTGDCIKVQTSNALVDCDGRSIRGTGYGGSGVSVVKYGILNGTVPSYVEVRNCVISNFRFGIFVEAGTYLAIHDNNSSDNFDDTDDRRYGIFLGMTEGGGIRINSASESLVTSNVTKSEGVGIDIRNSQNMTVFGNTSSDNSAWGINLYATVNSTVSSNVTSDNVRRCTWGSGVVGEGCDSGGIVLQGGSSNNTVSNNTVSGRNGNGIFIKAHGQPCGNNNSILNNTITGVMYNSIELSFCSGNRILSNTIQDGLDGIWLGYSHNTEIRYNTIKNMQNHGVISSNSHNNVISTNQIINSNEAIYFYSESFDRTVFYWLPKDGDYESHHNCLCSNTIQSNLTVGIRLRDSTNNQVTGNTFQWNGKTILMLGNGQGNDLTGNTTLSWLDPGRRYSQQAIRGAVAAAPIGP